MANKKVKPGHLRQHGEIRALITAALQRHDGFMYYTELKTACNGRNIQSTLRRMVDVVYVRYERIAPRVGVYRWNDNRGPIKLEFSKRPPQVPAVLTRWTSSSPYGNQTCKKN